MVPSLCRLLRSREGASHRARVLGKVVSALLRAGICEARGERIWPVDPGKPIHATRGRDPCFT
jgi:hypothetical protein